MRGNSVRAIRRLAAFSVAIAALAAPGAASADFLGPDLTDPVDGYYPCATGPSCTILGFEGVASLASNPTPIQAPTDGTITEVQLRVASGQEIPVELVAMSLVGAGEPPQVSFDSFHPLGTTTGVGIDLFEGLEVDLKAGTFLGIKLDGVAPQTIGNYATPGQNGVGLFDPSPTTGGSVDPLDNFAAGQAPAIRVQFVPEETHIPLPIDPEGDPPPPPGTADIEVTKLAKRPGRRVAVGGTTSFTIYVKNNGPEAAEGVTLFDRFGVGLIHEETKVLPTVGGANASCGGTFGKRGGGRLLCPIGRLAPGAAAAFRVFMKVSGRSSKGAGRGFKRKEKNLAFAVSILGPADPNLKNNEDSASVKIGASPGGCSARTIVGSERRNRLRGTRKADSIFALGGNDVLIGRRGGDCLFGGEGNDLHVGGPGRDYMDGEGGNDRFFARDGRRDTIKCGKGRDLVIADRIDRVGRQCERVRRV